MREEYKFLYLLLMKFLLKPRLAQKTRSGKKIQKLVCYCWSGKHYRVVRGLNIITLYYTDPQGRSLPVNYRAYDKAEKKKKNEYFWEMLVEVLDWGLKPAL